MKNLFLLSLILVVLFSLFIFNSSFAGVLVYSTYLGGGGDDIGFSIALDTVGNVYITGITYSSDFPTTFGAFDTTFNGYTTATSDVFITKLNPSGTAMVYSTFLGGSRSEGVYDIAVNGSGNAYIIGYTNSSTDFPTTTGAFDTSYNGGTNDGFVTELNPNGTALVYSTYLGGTNNDGCRDIAIDSSGNVYITGYTWSSNFPTTLGAFDTTFNNNVDVFVSKLNPSGTALVYSTFLGGSSYDYGSGIAIDNSENVYITGYTDSYNFPTTPGAFDTSFNGMPSFYDGFVSKLNASGTALVYSTCLGGSGQFDIGSDIVLDGSGNTYITGYTNSPDFPTTSGAFDTTYSNNTDKSGMILPDGFVTKLNPSGTALVYSTFLGGKGFDRAYNIALDGSGRAYIIGWTESADFPTTATALDTTYNNDTEAFVTELNPSGTALVYSTYLGGSLDDYGWGIALDSFGNIYVTGETESAGFPTTSSAFDTSLNGGYDAFITKFSAAFIPVELIDFEAEY